MPEREIDLEWLKSLEPNPEAEEFSRQEVEAGRIADLVEQFPNEVDRAISAIVLEELILQKELPRKGVWVRGAIILGDLDLQNAEIQYEVGIVESILRNNVSFLDARALRVLSFVDSTFLKAALFHRLRAESSVFLRGAHFHGQVDLISANISGQLSANKAKFLNQDAYTNFNSMKVGGSALFKEDVVFKGSVDFGHTEVGINLEAEGAKFMNNDATANFSFIKVAGTLLLRGTHFHGPVVFVRANIGMNFVINEAKFWNQEAKADFNPIRVDGNFSIRGAHFYGPTNFGGAFVGQQLQAQGACFLNLNEENKVNFNNAYIGDSIFLQVAQFYIPVDFGHAHIENNFEAENVNFINTNFNTIKVGGTVFLQEAHFHGPADFRWANIGINLEIKGAEFFNGVNFGEITIGGSVLFNANTFKGPVTISDARIGDLDIVDLVVEESSSPPILNLERAVISKLLRIKGTRLGALSSQDLKARTVYFEDVGLPDAGKLNLEGMDYDRIEIKSQETSGLESYRKLLERANYSRQPYNQMADFFRRKGEIGSWRRILIDMHRREREEPGLKGWFGKIWSYILDGAIGFGYRPWLVLIPSVAIVFIGTLVFNSSTILPLEESNPINPPVEGLYRFLYSLGLFLPLVDLPIVKAWAKTTYSNLAVWLWAHFQAIIGWILAAFGVAGLTPWVK